MATNSKIDFPSKIKGEKIHLYLHRHPLAMITFFALILAMVVIPIIFIIYSDRLGFNLDSLGGILQNLALFQNYTLDELYLRASEIMIAFVSSYLLFALAVFLTAFIDYYLDLAIITNKRIIDVEQDRLFSRSISEAYMVNVEDAKAKVNGFLQTMFHYGNVFIQTAGTQENFELKDIPDPYGVAKTIIDLHEEAVAEQEEVEAEDIGSMVGGGEQKPAARTTMENASTSSPRLPLANSSIEAAPSPSPDKIDEEKVKTEESMDSMKRELENFEKQAKENKSAEANSEITTEPLVPPAKPEDRNEGEISKDELEKGGEIDL